MKTDLLDFCKKFLWFRFCCNRKASDMLVLMSRVNEHLCYEAERGRVHGGGSIDDKNWILPGGRTRLVLQKAMPWIVPKNTSSPFDFYSRGVPLIENRIDHVLGKSSPPPMSANVFLNMPFSYLRASVFSLLFSEEPLDGLGFKSVEYRQAMTLGEKWELTGRWGDINRHAEGNWHVDDSILTTDGDSAAFRYFVFDANGIPQYSVELLLTQFGTLILPYQYLRREGSWGPRRVFFPPEEKIAVWGANRIVLPDVKSVILTDDPGILFQSWSNCPPDVTAGCFPGGASSVAKSDLAVLRGKNCILPLFDTSDFQSQLDFVMKVAARLRKMYIAPQFVHFPCPYLKILHDPQDEQPFEEPEVTELSLPALCTLANRCQIFVPEELRSDYLGDITSLIESKSPESVIPELFQLGDVLAAEVREDELPMLTAHLARCFQNGSDVFPKLWRVDRPFHTTVFVDGVQDKTAQALRGTGVRVCDVRFASAPENERLEMFRGVIAPTQIVLFASFELWEHAEAFLEVLRWCRQNEVAAILLTPEKGDVNLEEVRHLVTRTITVARIDGKAGMTVAVVAEGIPSIEAVFDPSGGLQQAKELSLDKREQVAPVQVRPSVPFDGKSLISLKGVPVEKKLAAIQAGLLPK